MDLADLNKTDYQLLCRADLMRALSAQAFARHSSSTPAEYFAKTWPASISKDVVARAFNVALQHKAAVAAGTTSDVAWAGPLVPPSLITAFVPLLEAASALLRLPLRRIPFATAMARQTADASYSWVAENKIKPVSKFAFANTTQLAPTKVSGITVLTKELVKLTAPGSVLAMQDALTAGLANFVDTQFLDPAITAIAGERPASITNGLTPVATGATLAATVAALVAAFYAALPQASALTTLVMSPANAGLLGASGQQPQLTAAGGMGYGVSVVTTPAAGNRIVMLDPTKVITARDEAPRLDVSQQAAVQMDSAPTDPAVAATVLVTFWQLNLVGIRCEWMLNYLALPNAAAYAVAP